MVPVRFGSVSDDHDEPRCGLCGGPLDGEWLGVEITRPDAQGKLTWMDEAFCSQDHAAAWLAEPLPPTEAMTSTPPLGWKGRVMGAAAFLVLVGAVGLRLLGSYALVRLLGGWD